MITIDLSSYLQNCILKMSLKKAIGSDPVIPRMYVPQIGSARRQERYDNVNATCLVTLSVFYH